MHAYWNQQYSDINNIGGLIYSSNFEGNYHKNCKTYSIRFYLSLKIFTAWGMFNLIFSSTIFRALISP